MTKAIIRAKAVCTKFEVNHNKLVFGISEIAARDRQPSTELTMTRSLSGRTWEKIYQGPSRERKQPIKVSRFSEIG